MSTNALTLKEAIAELKRIPTFDGRSWTAHDVAVLSRDEDHEVIATILNAVSSGDLIPKANCHFCLGTDQCDLILRTDAELAVAVAYQRAVEAIIPMRYEAGRNADGVRFQALDDAKYAILALAPAEPLAEVQALKDRVEKGTPLSLFRLMTERAEAAEAEVARLSKSNLIV